VLSNKTAICLVAVIAALVASSSVPAVASSGSQSAKVSDSYFKPGKITINKGTKVQWKWVGYRDHNVTVRSGPVRFHSKSQAQGTYSHSFTRKGTYNLVCTLHPKQMKETVVVK
jgi:plastocyanin